MRGGGSILQRESRPLVCLLGPVVVRTAAGETTAPPRLDRTVLAHLALAEGRVVSTDELIEALWGARPPDRARNSLQVKVSRLRNLLGVHASTLRHARSGYALVQDGWSLDTTCFAGLLSDAHHGMTDGRTGDAEQAVRDALALWRGTPLMDLDEHPRFVAVRSRMVDEWLAAQELLAEVTLEQFGVVPEVLSGLRATLERDPLRPKARLLLMRALERTGRRAEALAVYDAGRRVLAEETGIEPPAELQEAFEAILAAERRAVAAPQLQACTRAAPPGALPTARWLAEEGDPGAALQLALRGCWWWWVGGQRGAGRALLEDLVGVEPGDSVDPQLTLQASAWLAVFEAVEAVAETALGRGEQALRRAASYGWSSHEALAGVLLAERLHQRGEHRRANALTRASGAHFRDAGDAWGAALTRAVTAKGILSEGRTWEAFQVARRAVDEFRALEDDAGMVMALDALGYCAEVRGDLRAAERIHERAFGLARRVHAPEWETTQLTRLGSIRALKGDTTGASTLREAVILAGDIGSNASLALARNALGLARALEGDADEARDAHIQALAWYERQGSAAGVSYSAGRLAAELAPVDVDRASSLAEHSLSLAMRTTDPRAVAHSLECVAMVSADPVRATESLTAASRIRQAVEAPLPALLTRALRERDAALRQRLGRSYESTRKGGLALAQAWTQEGRRQSPRPAAGNRRIR